MRLPLRVTIPVLLALGAAVWLAWPTHWSDAPIESSANRDSDPAARLSAALSTTTPSDQVRSAVPVAETARPAPTGISGALLVRVWFGSGGGRTPAPSVGVSVMGRGMAPVWGRPSALTSEQGSVEFGSVPIGPVYVVTDRGIMSSLVKVAADSTTTVDIELAETMGINGLVVDELGRPVAGAAIEVLQVEQEAAALVFGTSAADGRFQLRGAPLHCAIGARARGHRQSTLQSVRGAPGATIDVRVVLPKGGGTITGRVQRVDGQAVARAVVRVGPAEQSFAHVDNPDGTRGFPRGPIQTLTDREGSFELAGLPEGRQRTVVRADDLVAHVEDVEVAAYGTMTLQVTLRDGGTIAGRITDDAAKPAPGVEVSVPAEVAGLVAMVRTTADGRFRLTGIRPGRVTITADGNRRGKVVGQVDVAELQTAEWLAQLSAGTVLSIRTIDAAGQPVPHVDIQASAPTATDPWAMAGRTDADGRLRIPNCPEALLLNVTASVSGVRIGGAQGVDPRAGELALEVKPPAKPTAIVVGRVTDTRAAVVQGAEIAVLAAGSGMADQHATDATTGRFELGPLSAGAYRLIVSAPGKVARTFEHRLGDGETWDLGQVELSSGGRIRVLADLSRLTGQHRAQVSVFDAGGKLATTLGADPALPLVTEALAAGEYRVELTGTGIATLSGHVTIIDGQEASLALRAEPGIDCLVRCRLSAADGGGDARLQIRDATGLVCELPLPAAGGTLRTTAVTLAARKYSGRLVARTEGPTREFTVATETQRSTIELDFR